jgi:hypothetical protein
MQPAEAVSREGIRELVARYNQLGDAGRLRELAGLFCRSAVLELDAARYEGRAEIGAMLAAAAAETRAGDVARYVRHFVATHSIEFAGAERATGRCYFLVLTDKGLDHWGRYQDEYRREDGDWRFGARRVVVEGQVPGGWAEAAAARLARESAC